MRRLPAVASVLTAGLLALTLLPSAAATPASQPGDPGDPPAVAADQAREALTRVRDVLGDRPGKRLGSRQKQHRADLDHGRSATVALRDLWMAQPQLRGSEGTAARQLLARPTAKIDRNPDNDVFELDPRTKRTDCTTSVRFCIHYTPSGEHAATPEMAAQVARTMDHVHTVLVDRMGFRAPVGDRAAASPAKPGNPDGKFDVFLGNIGASGFYGYCSLDAGRRTSYCALDNDFREFAGRPINALRVTAAHEYFHAIQYAYDPTEDSWLMEGSAVWAEERVFDWVNDYLQFVRTDSPITAPGIPVDQDSVYNGRVYAAMLFFEHLSQTLGVNRVREVWEAAVGRRHSLQAVQRVVQQRTSWPAFITRYAVWNSRPPGIGYSERHLYPTGRFEASRTLGWKGKRKMQTTMRRDHLASGSVRLLPARASTSTQRVRIAIDGPALARGSVAAVQRRLPNGKTTWSRVRLNGKGDAVTVQPFGKGRVRAVVVTLANASTRMRGCGTYGAITYSCGGYGAYNDTWRVSARVIR